MNSVFARKNYFYPDLPKGYQISQYDQPIVGKGKLIIDMEDGSTRTIGVTRIHLEEDAGKSVHDIGSGPTSHVDLNRAGIPLMEIVSEPDLRSSEEAGAYVKKLRSIVRYLGVCDGDMEKGSMRCDANVSVRKKGDTKFGTRCEIKNVNSIRNVMRAIEFEAQRQCDVLEEGGKIIQETRLWDANKNETRSMRGKEDAHDYRYFPDPDLLPVRLDQARVDKLKTTLPELPDEKKDRYMQQLGLGAYDASVLAAEKEAGDFYDAMLAGGKRDAKLCANWLTVELFGALNRLDKDITTSPLSPAQLGELVDLIENKTISGKIAKTVFDEMLTSGKPAADIVKEKGLVQITDVAAIEKVVDEVIASGPDNVAKYKAGQDRVMGWFVGEVMKRTQGKANPGVVNDLLKKKLS
jgi:aspartyl-tRNA(Asn)/glutamyl-tRNA(Gln) amidotransferase subunit B